MGWEKQMRKARRLHRPSLEDWECDGLYETFPEFRDQLLLNSATEAPVKGHPRDYESFIPDPEHTPVVAPSVPAVLDGRTLTTQEFWQDYEGQEIPSVIRNIPHGYDGGERVEPWRAWQHWPLDQLRQDADLRNRIFKCGEDDDGRSIKVKLKHFLRYLRSNKDDSPLYIFDSAFDEDRLGKRILEDYSVPIYFRDDLFRFISEQRRPPYRWFLVGPERSGTTIHIDPLATNAWNTLIQGAKRWVLFPPHVPKHIIKGKGLVRDDEDDEAIHYFMFILPRIKRKAAAMIQQQKHSYQSSSLPDSSPYKNFCCYEFTQYAGETVFVPNHWWHAVLNLTDTVAVTQNYCSERNFEKSWIKTRSGRKRMAWKLLQQLDARPEYQHLARRAKQMNQQDGFVMKYDPVEIAKREERAKLEKQRRKQKEDEKKDDGTTSSDEDDSDSDSDDDDDDSSVSRNKDEDVQRKKPRRKSRM